MAGSDYDLESLVEDEEEDKANLDYSVVLQLSMLILAFLFAYVLKRSNFHYLHEAGAAMMLGAFVGCTVKFAGGTKHSFKENMDFHEEIFFLVLLPPIIFESGYNMTQVKAFFRNFGGICVFAFLGTTISTVIIGSIVYFAGYCGLIYELNLINSLIFGALISATDPVTVLAIFQELRVDVDLYSLVFGESVLNDAVAIVLFKTLTAFTNTPVTTHGVIAAFLQFGVIFVGSLVIGTAVALSAAMLFKVLRLKGQEEFYVIETCLVVLFP
ncbi:hypothetical protein CYMTET_31726 [Cymbomonas tetramitiformis]|uniref:Cation/H+ exchanger transmembrane domain-containing protein n=1 Tax=Cymbomonas tetramitiformis TaxID=36881 RepID=A0AAE0FGF7_9CHLO|nr:hypothetical protein CYMTET_31726 [Cymbomonas tetramitiformis]